MKAPDVVWLVLRDTGDKFAHVVNVYPSQSDARDGSRQGDHVVPYFPAREQRANYGAPTR